MDEGSGEIVSREMAFEERLVAMRLADRSGLYCSGRFRNERYSCAARGIIRESANFLGALLLARRHSIS
jgi:hypothetical protein